MVPTIRAGGRRLRVATSRGRRLTVPSRWGLSVAACWRWATGIVATRRRLALRKNTSYACTVQNRACTLTYWCCCQDMSTIRTHLQWPRQWIERRSKVYTQTKNFRRVLAEYDSPHTHTQTHLCEIKIQESNARMECAVRLTTLMRFMTCSALGVLVLKLRRFHLAFCYSPRIDIKFHCAIYTTDQLKFCEQLVLRKMLLFVPRFSYHKSYIIYTILKVFCKSSLKHFANDSVLILSLELRYGKTLLRGQIYSQT